MWLAASASAELPSVRFDRLTPLGGAAGTQVEVEIAGADIEEVRALQFDHPGLTAAPVEGQERKFTVSIAADVPTGTYDVCLVGRFGVSNPRLFAVQQGLADVAEQEPNNSAEQAQRVELNVAIQGMSDGNDQDVFLFAARQGQRIVCDCWAGRLDSMLDATLTLTTAAGAPVAANGDYHGRDSQLDLVAPADGDYLLTIHDLSYRGGQPYRLLVSDHPQIESAFPRALRVGEPTEVTWLGRNLGADASDSPWQVDGRPLQERRSTVVAPAEIVERGLYSFLSHPTGHSTLPTAATCTLTGLQLDAGLPDALGEAPSFVVTDGVVSVEQEPNDAPEQATRLELPALISGRFDRPRDGDWYELEVEEGGAYSLEVYCERINGRADPFVAVVDDQGNRVTELDDFGHRINAFDGHLRDPSGQVNLTAKRKYRLLVQDRYSRGGARYAYVLSVRKPTPDFFVAAMHSQNPGPGATTLRAGGMAYLDLVMHQVGGFNGPVTVTAEELPPGVEALPTVLHGNHGILVLRAADDAAPWNGTIRLVATGERDGAPLVREVRPYTRVWTDAGMNSSRPLRRLPLAVRERAPFRVSCDPAVVEVAAGSPTKTTLRLERLWGDHVAPVTVLPLAFPGNFKLANQEFAGERRDLEISIEVQAGTRPGDYTLVLLGQSQVPFHKDPQSAERPNTLVSLPSQPLTVRVVEAK